MKPEIKALVIYFCVAAIVAPPLEYFAKGNLILSFLYFGLELILFFAYLITGESKKIGLQMEMKSIWVKILISTALLLEGAVFLILSRELTWVRETDWGYTAVLFLICAVVVLYIGRRIFSFLE